jgi:4-hydroxythreonine-4-phosphate dehydrogenase
MSAAISAGETPEIRLACPKLAVIHVSTHVALREACDRATKERVLTVIRLADKAVKALGVPEPRIAVAGLNPHSGESGLFGHEEIEEIIPAIEAARGEGMNVTGPVPPDTVFVKTLRGESDIVVAMYHDQGHIPLKITDFMGGVNVTVGLPIIRTSVDHGTAYGKAGKGTADESSMVSAVRAAVQFARNR